MEELEKERLTKKERLRLRGQLKEVDPKKRKLVEGLIEEAAFLKSTMEELKQIVILEGPLDTMEQGNYSITREHPALKAYNTAFQRYTTAVEKLTNLLPKEMPKLEEEDELEKFLIKRGTR